ncbi:glycoside hydrolase family 16 protein [Cellvibrio japonicus]|uniref:Beta glucanase, putative, glu16A n=1 Tax=Cellvibrio japonicus (strain Ueda107) TaxID=498211 RepID=B3PGH0_CELJU|nr:glycoside hydrolase family 16 protein [Cellvibrio japonicus]ACE84208.1 beta glucanase, putative, glu16A [Cellvibrio japonicus Ueda107]QEI10958.1 family 16 glycosylhydrolase [Cellvibrio japonicus]QEI14534.1 family 16 glycosylhydrolase [Cellvibrio japonicus]QEI18112.1 family 16 glycosylhydrolase [Cellvibrio japonicus]
MKLLVYSSNAGGASRALGFCLTLTLLGLIGCGGSSGGSSKSSSSAALSSSLASESSVSLSSESSSVELSSSSSAETESSSSVDDSSSSESDSSSSVDASESSSSATGTGSSSSTGWTLVWSDEFEGDAIDPAKWGHEQNCWGGGNNEQQCYTDRAENSFIEEGVLHIVARRESFTGPNTPDGTGDGNTTLPYTSARLRTKGLEEWTFGRFEIRAKMPQGQGTWPAVWMLPTDSPYGIWASSGEIDIVEAVNLKTQTLVNGELQAPEARVHGTLHYGRVWPGNVNSGAAYTLPEGANPADDFHVYALEWEEGEIRWYVDGVHYATQRSSGWYSQYLLDGVLTDAPEGAPYDAQSRYHLLLNLAVGGNWAANTNNLGIDESVFPQTLQIDYVRVYECSVSPQTGKGCATLGDEAELVRGYQRPGIGPVELPGPPQLVMYEDNLIDGLAFDSYDPDNHVSYSEVDEGSRGNVIHLVKAGDSGNLYFRVNGDPYDLRHWSLDSELVFDVKLNSKAEGAVLRVKLDSGWPNVSDTIVPLGAEGEWTEFRISLGDLVNSGNSIEPGKANLASIANIFVMEPSAEMDVSFDNIRIEGEANQSVFADVPLYTIYADAVPAELQIQSFNPDNNSIVSTQVAEEGRGNVFNVVKSRSGGNVFFNITAGAADLNHWADAGELVFDVKVNSRAEGAGLLVKIDSGWPNVSDANVTLAPDGEWTEFRIAVADLINNGNSITAGIANLNAISNIFVIEPTGVMDVSFDNIRLVVPSSYSIYDDAPHAELQILTYNDDGLITTSGVEESGRGNVFRVVKSAAGQGNAYFNNTAGPRDITAWLDAELVFDYKISSHAEGAYLLIKMDSGWPNASDVLIEPAAENTDWAEYRIRIADLINDGNHYTSQADKANPLQILNLFVIEPQAGAMDVSFDNIRVVIE